MAAEHSPADLIERLRKAINGVRAVMVGVAAEGAHHFSPMRGHQVEGEAPVWFLGRRDIHLVQELAGQTRPAVLNVVSEDHHLHASVEGRLTAERDQARIDQFWSSVADAWLPEGRTSPSVILLRFDPVDAHVWLSDNSFKLAFEVARANLERREITSGEKAILHLDAPNSPVVP